MFVSTKVNRISNVVHHAKPKGTWDSAIGSKYNLNFMGFLNFCQTYMCMVI